MNSEPIVISQEEIEKLVNLIRERINYADKDKEKYKYDEEALKHQQERLLEYKLGYSGSVKEPTCGINNKPVTKCINELKEQKLKNIRKELNDDNGFKENILDKLPALEYKIKVLENELNELDNPKQKNINQKVKSFFTSKNTEIKKGLEEQKYKDKIQIEINSLYTIIEQIESLKPIYETPFDELDKKVTTGGKRKNRRNKRKTRRNKRNSRRNKRKTSRR